MVRGKRRGPRFEPSPTSSLGATSRGWPRAFRFLNSSAICSFFRAGCSRGRRQTRNKTLSGLSSSPSSLASDVQRIAPQPLVDDTRATSLPRLSWLPPARSPRFLEMASGNATIELASFDVPVDVANPYSFVQAELLAQMYPPFHAGFRARVMVLLVVLAG